MAVLNIAKTRTELQRQLEEARQQLDTFEDIPPEMLEEAKKYLDEKVKESQRELKNAEKARAKLDEKDLAFDDVWKHVRYGNKYRYEHTKYNKLSIETRVESLERQIATLDLMDGDTMTIRPSRNNELSVLLGL